MGSMETQTTEPPGKFQEAPILQHQSQQLRGRSNLNIHLDKEYVATENEVYPYNAMWFSLKKKKKILPYATTWMKFEDVMLISVDLDTICLWSLLK